MHDDALRYICITSICGLPTTAGGFSLLHFHWAYAKNHYIVTVEHAIYGFSFYSGINIGAHAQLKLRDISNLR